MNREQIARRIDLIGPSTGAIVSVATWCALHGAEADAIMAHVVEKMKHRDTSDAQRASLIYMIHELLLTCATRGVSDSAKQSILVAVSRTLPRSIQDTLRYRPGDHAAFLVALQKATEWWAMLNLFPAAWLAQLQRTTQQALEAAAGQQQHSPLPSALLQVATLMQRYQHAKEQWLRNKQIKAGESSLGADAAANTAVVDDAAHRCLVALRKAAESRFERNGRLLAWCEAERAELEGRAIPAPSQLSSSPAGTAIKLERNTTASSSPAGVSGGEATYAVKEEPRSGGAEGTAESGGKDGDDDVLGSFF